MKLSTTAFADHGAIPGECAFAVADPASHVRLSTNRNPDLAWSGLPSGARSLAILCSDPDVPSKPDDVNQEGRVVARTLPRITFYHWVLVDLPPSVAAIERGAHSDGVVARGKPGPASPREGRHGINDYTLWFAGDAAMGGDYYGYDGPCPPWNDELPHRYVFTLYALDVPRLELPDRFTGQDALAAMDGHILAQASLTGRFTLNPAVRL